MGVETVIILGITYGMVYQAIATALISFAISYAAQKLFGVTPETPKFDQSITENIDGATNPIPIIYGSRRVGGTRVFVETSGASNTYLHTVLAMCEGEIHSIDDILLSDISITDAKFSGSAWGYKHTGADDQTVDASLNGLLPDKWTENHRLQGTAYVYVRLKFNQNIFSSIPTILCDIKGKKVYDPRTETSAWSDNPALCLRDYLTNTRYGRGIPVEMIDDDAIIAAANYCEEQVTFKDPSGSAYNDNRYRCCGAINPDDGYLDNVKKILSSCRGMLIFSSGKYKLVIDKPETAAFTFNEDNIVGKINIGMGDKSIVFNRMRVRYFDTDLGYEQNYFTYDNPTLRANQDNGLILEGDLELPLTNEIVRVEQIAQMEVKRSRQSIVCQFDSTLEALKNDVGDVVNVTYLRAGWPNKKFRVVKIGLKSEDTVEVSLKEYDASVYVMEAWVPPGEPDTLTPGLWNYDPPNNVSAASGNTELLIAGDGSLLSRLRLSWTAPENGYCTGFEVGYKLSSEENYTDFAKGKEEAQHIFSPVQDGVDYDLRVRAVYFNGGHSEWVYTLDHTVQGKSALPDTPDGFSVTNEPNNVKKFVWNSVGNLDLRGYRLRMKSGSTGEWSEMTSLHSGNLAGSPWETGSISETGAHRFGLVSVDTSGNESLPVYFNMTLESTGESSTPPGAPSGLAATAMYLSVFLEWTNPTENFSATEVWISATNDRAAAVRLAVTSAPIFQIEREDETPFFVWLRSLNSAGTPGPFNSDDDDGLECEALIVIDSTSAAAITATAAKIANLYAANIAAGSISSGTVIIGPGGAIRSHDYEHGNNGWFFGHDLAEVCNLIIRNAQLIGGIQQSLNFQTGAQGAYINWETGDAEFHTLRVYGSVAAPVLFIGGQAITGGYYVDAVDVSVVTMEGTTVRYTTDGTVPDETDAAVSGGTLTISASNNYVFVAYEDSTGRASIPVICPFRIARPLSTGGFTPFEFYIRIRSYFDTDYVLIQRNNNDPTTGAWIALPKKKHYRSSGILDGFVFEDTYDFETGSNLSNQNLIYCQSSTNAITGRIGPIYKRVYNVNDASMPWGTSIYVWTGSAWGSAITAPGGTLDPDDYPG
ncbi:MAG TPA: phage tail protein [Pontiellaceae bacterium]|nr:phage tail protein [Pontiellaceae bacterium]